MKVVTTGATRIVFIFDKIVIKIPWINFLRIFKICLKSKKDGSFNKKIERFNKNKILAIFYYTFYLLSANRREYLYFKKNFNEKSLLPIKGIMFGFIIIQPKGEVFKDEHPRWEKFLSKIIETGVDDRDLLKAENFCIYYNEIKLLDYGSTSTHSNLKTFGFRILIEQ